MRKAVTADSVVIGDYVRRDYNTGLLHKVQSEDDAEGRVMHCAALGDAVKVIFYRGISIRGAPPIDTESHAKGPHCCMPIWRTIPKEGYGNAIDLCEEHEDGTFWAGNSEYGSQVNFCPFCGQKAPVQIVGLEYGVD